jgi:hypothetical protein
MSRLQPLKPDITASDESYGRVMSRMQQNGYEKDAQSQGDHHLYRFSMDLTDISTN